MKDGVNYELNEIAKCRKLIVNLDVPIITKEGHNGLSSFRRVTLCVFHF